MVVFMIRSCRSVMPIRPSNVYSWQNNNMHDFAFLYSRYEVCARFAIIVKWVEKRISIIRLKHEKFLSLCNGELQMNSEEVVMETNDFKGKSIDVVLKNLLHIHI